LLAVFRVTKTEVPLGKRSEAGTSSAPQQATLEMKLYNAPMQQQEFSIDIKAPREKVWNVLWDDATFRDWANIIDEGTYMVGELKEGHEVQFISSVGGYGVTSLVEKLIPSEYVLLRHSADTKEVGAQEREKEWTGGTESYSLAEREGIPR
jgi:hypothetical protein